MYNMYAHIVSIICTYFCTKYAYIFIYISIFHNLEKLRDSKETQLLLVSQHLLTVHDIYANTLSNV